ncbi:MAG TPA: MFS transporter [Solirubrobacteraceae bacterium]|nr:MFS transporter [Solirubrobacteraceae bacterium]
MLRAYGRLFDPPEARRLVAASAGARLAIGIYTLPLLLSVQEATGSFAVAGVAGGAFSVGVAAAAPLRGRMIDRHGARAALPAMALVSTVALALVAVLAGDASAAVLVALSGVSGAATPPLVASMRLEWQRVLGEGDERLGAAYAFESALQTAVFVVGPLLAGLGLATIGARASLGASAALLLAGSLVFAAVARTVPDADAARDGSPIRLPGVLTLVLMTGLADVGLGGIDVVVAAYAERRGTPELAGVLLAVCAAGAIAGALVYGMRQWRLPLATQLVLLSLTGAVTIGVLALPSAPVLLGALLFLACAPSAGQWAAASVALDTAAGGRAGAEAFTWLSAANSIGVGVGTVLGGAAVEEWGTGVAFLLVATGPLLAAVVLAVRPRTLA